MESSISPITLSSTTRNSASTSELSDLKTRPEKCDSVISIGSSDYQHVHLGWKRRNKASKCLQPNSQLSNIEKVANWIKSIEESSSYDVSDVDYENEIYKINKGKPNNILNDENKGFVVVRCDFLKPVSSQPGSYKKHLNTMSYPKSMDKFEVQPSNNLFSIPKKNEIRNSKREQNNARNISDKISLISSDGKKSYSSIKYDEKSDVSSDLNEQPKSIEVQKKELCTYLKLMDPSDKKEILALQNRRSTRVRNLAALRERTKLESNVRDINSEIILDNEDRSCHSVCIKENKIQTDHNQLEERICHSLQNTSLNSSCRKTEINSLQKESYAIHKVKSKEDPNIKNFDTQKVTNNLKEFLPQTQMECSNYSFYLPFPPKHYSKKIENFDSTMRKLIPKFKISLAKNSKESSITNCTLKCKNKENVQYKEEKLEKNSVKLETSNTASLKDGLKKKSKRNLSNNLKYQSKINIIPLKSKKQMTNRKLNNFNSNLYNVKLRSAKFKIRLKRIPTHKDFIKKKQNIKKICDNSKSVEKFEMKSNPKISFNEDMAISENNVELPENNSHFFLKETNLEPVVEVKSNILNFLSENEIENGDIDFMLNIKDFNNLTEEHKKCLIESRLFINKSMEENKSGPEEVPPLYGFSISDVNEIKLMCEIFEQSILKHSQEPFNNYSENNQTDNLPISTQDENLNIKRVDCTTQDFIGEDHNYISAGHTSNEKCCSSTENSGNINTCSLNSSQIRDKHLTEKWCLQIDPNDIEENNCTVLPYSKNVQIKSLQKSLNFVKKKNIISSEVNICNEWDVGSPKLKTKKLSHFISISKENGEVLKVFYVDFNLVICQEFVVSFWLQTPLGNVLGSQDMWIPRGYTQRLMLNNKCVQKESREMFFCSETNVAYIELWTKEHKSDIREGPVADIFITIYFWKQRQNGIDKKVLQLENINGFADDVQYCVVRSSAKIIVCWHVTSEDNAPRTFVHSYQLADDYQMVSYISEIEPVEHYVSSLHNIESCDNLIVGCGEQKITLWNLEYGHKIATIALSEIGRDLSTLWVKCDRGFLFAIQQCENRELRLIAINGINHTWKKLASYFPSEEFDKLKGVCIENGLLLSCYDRGVLCWKAETGEPLEEITMDTEFFTCGNHIIFLEENKVFVRHSLTHVLSVTADDQ